MKSTLYGISLVLTFVFCGSGVAVFGQSTPDEVVKAQAMYNKVLDDSGRYFKEGLDALRSNKRENSGEKFDKAVEVFLYSALNIQRDARLQGCYSQVIETIYRIEYPNNAQPPQIRQLSATCGWNWNDTDYKSPMRSPRSSSLTSKSRLLLQIQIPLRRQFKKRALLDLTNRVSNRRRLTSFRSLN
jgi:hypothetical protein